MHLYIYSEKLVVVKVEDESAKEMMKDIVVMLSEKGHSKEEIKNYVKADLVEEVFKEMERGKGGE